MFNLKFKLLHLWQEKKKYVKWDFCMNDYRIWILIAIGKL